MSNLVLNQREVKIRKPRRCYGCMEVFPIGSKMEYQAGTYEDGFWTCYHCEYCTMIKKGFKREDYEDGYAEGWFHDMRESKGQNPKEFYLSQSQTK